MRSKKSFVPATFEMRAEREIEGMDAELVQVHSYKYDGRISRRWQGLLVRQEQSLLVIDGVFEEEIRHPFLGTIQRGTRSVEYYWTDRCYSILRFTEPAGQLRNHYCNIHLPPRLKGGVLGFVDLDIDVLVAPDFSYRILDEDEFDANAAAYGYPSDVRRRARQALDELLTLIHERGFPFTGHA